MPDFTNQETRRIKEKLRLSLGPEYVSYRKAYGNVRVAYIEGWRAFNIANNVFGFNGWSSHVISVNIDYCDAVGENFNIGISSTVRITLKDGTYHEDTGYGTAENMRKGAAYEKARKESITDATKRALRMFGNCLGNCLYDRRYLDDIKAYAVPKREKIRKSHLLYESEQTTQKPESESTELNEYDFPASIRQ